MGRNNLQSIDRSVWEHYDRWLMPVLKRVDIITNWCEGIVTPKRVDKPATLMPVWMHTRSTQSGPMGNPNHGRSVWQMIGSGHIYNITSRPHGGVGWGGCDHAGRMAASSYLYF